MRSVISHFDTPRRAWFWPTLTGIALVSLLAALVALVAQSGAPQSAASLAPLGPASSDPSSQYAPIPPAQRLSAGAFAREPRDRISLGDV